MPVFTSTSVELQLGPAAPGQVAHGHVPRDPALARLDEVAEKRPASSACRERRAASISERQEPVPVDPSRLTSPPAPSQGQQPRRLARDVVSLRPFDLALVRERDVGHLAVGEVRAAQSLVRRAPGNAADPALRRQVYPHVLGRGGQERHPLRSAGDSKVIKSLLVALHHHPQAPRLDPRVAVGDGHRRPRPPVGRGRYSADPVEYLLPDSAAARPRRTAASCNLCMVISCSAEAAQHGRQQRQRADTRVQHRARDQHAELLDYQK